MYSTFNAVIYQIKDWTEIFENDRSRQRERCSFVCVPNKQHGMGFARIMAEPDGASIYGIWCMMLGACSQQQCGKKNAAADWQSFRDGWLTEDGLPTGEAWDAADLAVKFRRPVAEIHRCLEVVSSRKIGWMRIVKNPHEQSAEQPLPDESNRQLTADSPSSPPNERKERTKEEKEENRNEAKNTGAPNALTITPQAREASRLLSLCKEQMGEQEIVRNHKRWRERAWDNPERLERVLGELKAMRLEGKIKTTPARVAEDLFKRFQ